MKREVEVTLFSLVRKSLSYEVAGDFSEDDLLGRRVVVPLGNRRQMGIITSLDVQFEGPKKQVDSFPDLEPVMTAPEIKLARFISEYYFCSLAETIKAVLPSPLTARLNQRVVLRSRQQLNHLAESGDSAARELLRRLSRRTSLSAASVTDLPRDRIRYLTAEGIIALEWNVRQSSELLVDSDVHLGAAKAEEFRLTAKQEKALSVLLERRVIDAMSLCREFTLTRKSLREMANRGLIVISPKPPFRGLLSVETVKEFDLNPDQISVVKEIVAAIRHGGFAPFLLYGVTGSGKTEVYIRAIQETITLGRSALVIVPEIGLSEAIYYRLESVFAGKIGLIHSRLSPRARLEIWRQARNGALKIVLGPRSAIFASFPKLGLIVVDEEHDQSLKQDSPAPRYHARDLAIYRAREEGCPVILGSATPSVESFYNAQIGKYRSLQLPQRVDQRRMPKVTIVDLKGAFEKRGFGYLTDELVERIKGALANQGQVMLLLNRRGFAPSVHCFSCGYQFVCRNCAVSLVYHKVQNSLLCHTCGFHQPYVTSCPSCSGNLFLYKGIGTQKLEEELRRGFPEVTLLRMDFDSTRRRGEFQKIYRDFHGGRARILLGTQMISKGFDFPDVALVGIVSADTALEMPDFRSRERTFQLLTQASGRAGRQNFPGEVVIQTLHPQERVVAQAAEHDYRSFYDREIIDRNELGFPPFSHLILLEIESAEDAKAMSTVKLLAEKVRSMQGKMFRILGPTSAPIARKKTRYRYHLLLKTRRVKSTLSFLEQVLEEKALHSGQYQRIIVDVDPVDMM